MSKVEEAFANLSRTIDRAITRIDAAPDGTRVRIACGALVQKAAWSMWALAAATGNRVSADFNGVRLVADFPAAVAASVDEWREGMRLTAERESPLDRDLREIDEAFANWKQAVRNCRDGEATPEDVKRYTLALYALMDELRDVMPYSENS